MVNGLVKAGKNRSKSQNRGTGYLPREMSLLFFVSFPSLVFRLLFLVTLMMKDEMTINNCER